jgi:hypothetical protein
MHGAGCTTAAFTGHIETKPSVYFSSELSMQFPGTFTEE